MHERLHRHRRGLALLASLATAATISVVAPAASASAHERDGTSSTAVQAQHDRARLVHPNSDWVW